MNQKKKLAWVCESCREPLPSAAGMEEMRMAAGIIFVILIVIGVFGIKSYAKKLVRRGCENGSTKNGGRKKAS